MLGLMVPGAGDFGRQPIAVHCPNLPFCLLLRVEQRKRLPFEQSICLLIAPNRLPSPRHR
jgi:hypothetical protein